MEIVLGTASFTGGRATDGYLFTLGRELLRLGHRVTVFVTAGAAALADEGGLHILNAADAEGTWCDAAVASDGVSAYALARLFPEAPQVFVAHGEPADAELPPQLGGVVRTAVALNERTAARLRGLAQAPRVIRLSEPAGLDVGASPERPLRDPPRRLLALGGGQPLRLLEEVAARRNLEFEVAEPAEGPLDPRRIAEADLVVGTGRAIVDAMAAGRAAYVWGRAGRDGWVRRETYEALAADGFSGRAFPAVADRARLSAELDAYTPGLGAAARELAAAHHRPAEHAEAIVGLLREAGAPESAPVLLTEVERLTRLLWWAEVRQRSLVREVEDLRLALLDAERAAADGRLRRFAATVLARASAR